MMVGPRVILLACVAAIAAHAPPTVGTPTPGPPPAEAPQASTVPGPPPAEAPQASTVSGPPPAEAPQASTVVLRVATVLDGRGATLTNRDIEVANGRIQAVVPAGQGRGDAVYDLSGMTGEEKVGSMLLDFMLNSPFAAPWFRATDPDPAPAVSEWGRAGLALLLLTAGSLVFARRAGARAPRRGPR